MYFTKGPWRAEGPDEFGDYNILHPGNTLAVGAVVSNLRPPEKVAANANLVAAAPELYEVLSELRNAVFGIHEQVDFGHRVGVAMSIADRILAKARGESEAQS